jgi:hypothetical protein
VGTGYAVRVIAADFSVWDNSDAAFVITAGNSLSLTSPNGGENWEAGTSRSIAWNTYGYSGNVHLVLFKNGVKLGNIARDLAASSGSYSWTVGSYIGGTAAAGNDYTVRVTSTDFTIKDDSDAAFAIAESTTPRLTLTSPDGGESWAIGSTQNISWDVANYTGSVHLVLFKGATKLGNIARDLAASSGSYSWTVGSYIGGTAVAGNDYIVRVTSTDFTVKDDSGAAFALTAGGTPSLTVTSPDGGESWTLGSTQDVTWSVANYSGNVHLVLFKDGVKIGNIARNLNAAAGSYSWTVGNYIGGTVAAGSGYTVRVTSTDFTVKDDSDAGFSLTD